MKNFINKIIMLTFCFYFFLDCKGSTQSIAGNLKCTVVTACNYLDEGNCLYNDCNGECGGSAVLDNCEVCEGDGTSCIGSSMESIYYNSTVEFAGFQFSIYGVDVISIFGGESEAAGFMMSSGNNNVIGFSLSGSSIDAGQGVLIEIEQTGLGNICISEQGLVISDPVGNPLCALVENCNYIVISECI